MVNLNLGSLEPLERQTHRVGIEVSGTGWMNKYPRATQWYVNDMMVLTVQEGTTVVASFHGSSWESVDYIDATKD